MALGDDKVPSQFPTSVGNIAFVAEAPGVTELKERIPLVGASGQEFNRMLLEAGINRTECYVGNLFDFKLPGNKVEAICGGKKEMPKDYPYPAIAPGNYLRPRYFHNLERLKAELESVRPNVVVPLGNTALWAVCKTTGIKSVRGSLMTSSLIPGMKVIPTFHPAAILRKWDDRLKVITDLMKVLAQSTFPEIRRPKREVWIEPVFDDLELFYEEHIRGCELLSVDIETSPARRLITTMSFAPNSNLSLSVPLVDLRQRGDYSYWPDLETEKLVWEWIRKIMEDPEIPKLFQGGTQYDIPWFLKEMGIKVYGAVHDTMLLHHSLYPEMEKGLAFLGSIYTNEVAWKLMRPRGQKTENRSD